MFDHLGEKILFWIRFGVGLAFFWAALTIFDRVGDFWESLNRSDVQGYGAWNQVPPEVWVAARKCFEAVSAVGAAVLAVCWSVLKSRIKSKWPFNRKEKAAPQLPPPGVPHDEAEQRRKLMQLLRKLRSQ